MATSFGLDTDASVEHDWPQWVERLAGRKRPSPLRNLAPKKKTPPLLWAQAADAGDDSESLIRKLYELHEKKKSADRDADCIALAQRLEGWLSEPAGERKPAAAACEALAWCHALPALSQFLPAAPWWQLVEHLAGVAREAAGLDLQTQPLEHQLLAGELPLALSYLLPELDSCRKLGPPAARSLSLGVNELLDGDGTPASRCLAEVRPLLACWTRCGLLAREAGSACFDEDAQLKYEWFVRQSLRLTRHDGTQVFSNGVFGGWSKPLFEAALALSGDKTDRRLAGRVLPGQAATEGKQRVKLPEPSAYSEWAGLAVMRSDWNRRPDQLTAAFSGRQFVSELNSGRRSLWSGPHDTLVSVDGRLLEPQSDWQELCWHSDDDVDYLEVEVQLGDGWRLQRQTLLAREDGFVLMCDAVVGQSAARIDYQTRLPLCKTIRLSPASESNEAFLTAGDDENTALCLPLALPEWRADVSHGSLAADAGSLQLAHVTECRRLYAPLLIDLDRRRIRKPFTWRRLTVAERLDIVPADVAVGYRVQVGRRQWLIYRSLAPQDNRTVLGQNLSAEFLVARFKTDGTTETLVEIDG